MDTKKELKVTFTRSYKGEPLAVVHNMPGLDAEMFPAHMRAVAAALQQAAAECESRPMGKRSFRQVTKIFPL